MSEVLYEQYKDALRRGHVAALRGRLDAAAAYREAARIAPDRALPYVGLGGVLTRLGRRRTRLPPMRRCSTAPPADEGALRGKADVLVALGRRAEAAETPTAWPRSSSVTGAWPTRATSPAARSSWPNRAVGAARSRASWPGSGAQRRGRRALRRRSTGRSASWSPRPVGGVRGRPARPPTRRPRHPGDRGHAARAAAAGPGRS